MRKGKTRSFPKVRMAVLLSLVALLAVGCASTTRSGIKSVGSPVVDTFVEKLMDSKSAELLKDGMAGNLIMLTGMAELAPENRLGLQQCAMLYASYGMMVEDEDPEYAKVLYAIGKDYGLRALKTNRAFRIGLAQGKKIPELVDELGEEYAAAMCWTGLNIGLLILHQMEDPMALMALPDSVSLIQKSVEYDPDYYHGVGKAYLGAYYAMVPEFLGLGGGPEASAKMFEEARRITGGKFLMVDVFEARYLATYMDDAEKFDRLLNRVMTTPNEVLPGGTAMNDLAKMKAKYYLSIKDQLF
ncbi:MAG: hypothetical protein JRI97_08520 [Deltaproteobacteria bacterium]|nr:hypothetical protein [Deltaproteobacteria bacterium]